MLLRQLVDVADLDIFSRHDSWPLGASTEEPFAPAEQPRRMKGVAGNEQLNAMAASNVWSDNDPFGRRVRMQQENLERIAEVIMVELIVADPVGPNGRM